MKGHRHFYILIRLYLKYDFPRPPSRFIFFFIHFHPLLLTIHRDIPLVFHNRIKSGFEEEKHVLLEMISLTCRDKLTILCLTTIHKRSYDRCDSTWEEGKLFNWSKTLNDTYWCFRLRDKTISRFLLRLQLKHLMTMFFF